MSFDNPRYAFWRTADHPVDRSEELHPIHLAVDHRGRQHVVPARPQRCEETAESVDRLRRRPHGRVGALMLLLPGLPGCGGLIEVGTGNRVDGFPVRCVLDFDRQRNPVRAHFLQLGRTLFVRLGTLLLVATRAFGSLDDVPHVLSRHGVSGGQHPVEVGIVAPRLHCQVMHLLRQRLIEKLLAAADLLLEERPPLFKAGNVGGESSLAGVAHEPLELVILPLRVRLLLAAGTGNGS